MILIHYTATSSIEEAIQIFQKPSTESSSHYIIGKDGKIIQMVRDEDQAFHAGPSHWRGKKSCNRFSIGIELVNEGKKQKVIPYTKEQYDSLITLCRKLIRKYAIPPERILGHSDVASPVGRKRDPGPHFDWE
jgi:N-acetylmuramoyl-L-alanine amidase